MRGISSDERRLLNHCIRWGSLGYPINHVGRVWTWGPFCSVKGPPGSFKTRREAVASFEAFHDVLLAALGEIAKARALGEEVARKRN